MTAIETMQATIDRLQATNLAYQQAAETLKRQATYIRPQPDWQGIVSKKTKMVDDLYARMSDQQHEITMLQLEVMELKNRLQAEREGFAALLAGVARDSPALTDLRPVSFAEAVP